MNDLISSLNNLNSNGGTGLPSPKGATGLPSPKGAMPTPSPLGQAGLPSPKSAMGLPSPKGAMPTPSPLGQAGLPNSKAGMSYVNPSDTSLGVKRPMIHSGGEEGGDYRSDPLSLYVQKLGAGSQRKNTVALSSIDFDKSSYSSQEIRPVPLMSSGTEQARLGGADPLGLYNPDDSALNIPKLKLGDELSEPMLKTGHQEPAAFNPTHDIHEDSGLPLMDDPLSLMGGEPLFSAELMNDSTKLPKEERKSSIPKDKMDLFSALGGAIKMPDDVTPIPQAMGVSVSKGPDDATPIPQSMRGSMASLMTAADSMASSASNLKEVGGDVVEAEDEDGDELVFDINSIKSDEKSVAQAVTVSKAEAEDKVELKFWQKKSFIGLMIAGLLLGLLSFAVVKYVYDARNVGEDELAYIPEQVEVELSMGIIRADRLANYDKFYKDSKAKIALMEDGPERQEIQGQILISMILSMVRFPEEFNDEVEILDGSVSKIAETCKEGWCAFGLWAWGTFRGNESMSAEFVRKLPDFPEMRELKPLMEIASQYIHWAPERQTFKEYEKTGEKVLSLFPKDVEFKDWPIGAWLKASTLKRLGRHREALEVLAPFMADETKPYPGILTLATDLYLATNKSEQAVKTADIVFKIPQLLPKEKRVALNQKMIAESSVDSWDVFQKNFIEFGKAYGNELSSASALAESCIRTNIADKCRILIQGLSSVAPKNGAMRHAYIRILLAGLGYKNIVRSDRHINKALVALLVKTVDEGIKIDPKDIELWKLKVLASFAERDYEGAVNAMDEIERGEKLEWFGSYLRQMISYADADGSEREEIRTSLKSSAERIWGVEDGLILALALDYVDEGIVALELLNRISKLYPESTLILDSKFDLAASLGNREYAEQTVKMLEGRRAMLTHYEFDYAKLIEMRGDPSAALEHMLKLIGKDPENSVYLSYIGELFFKQNQCDSAMQYLEQSLEINPNNALARFYRGRCRFDEGRYEDALNEFNEAATQEETNLLYMLWIGRCLSGLNQLLDAERSFTTVIDSFTAQNAEAQQVHDPANLPEAYFRRAEIKKLQNRRTEARQDYLKSLELMPESVEYLTGYSIYLYENEILGECIDHVTQIENILGDKADPRLYFVRGLSYLKQNNRSEAISDLEHALKLGFAELSDSRIIGIREPAEIYERLGYLYRDIGKREQARKSLLMFLEKTTSISERTRKEIQGQIDRI